MFTTTFLDIPNLLQLRVIQQIRYKVRIWLHVLDIQRQTLLNRTGYFQKKDKVRLSPLYAQLLAYLLEQNITNK